MKPEQWWALVDKRGRLLRSFVLDTPMLFRTRQEAKNWMEGSDEILPAPDGTRAVRVSVTVSGEVSK